MRPQQLERKSLNDRIRNGFAVLDDDILGFGAADGQP